MSSNAGVAGSSERTRTCRATARYPSEAAESVTHLPMFSKPNRNLGGNERPASISLRQIADRLLYPVRVRLRGRPAGIGFAAGARSRPFPVHANASTLAGPARQARGHRAGPASDDLSTPLRRHHARDVDFSSVSLRASALGGDAYDRDRAVKRDARASSSSPAPDRGQCGAPRSTAAIIVHLRAFDWNSSPVSNVGPRRA